MDDGLVRHHQHDGVKPCSHSLLLGSLPTPTHREASRLAASVSPSGAQNLGPPFFGGGLCTPLTRTGSNYLYYDLARLSEEDGGGGLSG